MLRLKGSGNLDHIQVIIIMMRMIVIVILCNIDDVYPALPNM